MNHPSSEFPNPDEPLPVETVHRKRRKRSTLSDYTGEQAAILEALRHIFYPSIDFWIYSFLSGLVIGLAVLTNSLPLFVLAAVIAPFLAPSLGLAFATISGSLRNFFQVLGGVLIGLLLVIFSSALVGWVSPGSNSQNLGNSREIIQFSWIGLAVVFVGAILTTIFLLRSQNNKAMASSVILAYTIYIPLGISGFGLSENASGLWPQGFYLSLLHLTWTIIIGVFTFGASGLRPKNFTSFFLGAALLVAGAAGLLSYNMAPSSTDISPEIKISPTSLIQTEANEESATPVQIKPTTIPSATRTPTIIKTSTPAVTAQPTSVFAIIKAEGNGAIVRLEPDLNAPSALTPLMDGTEVKVLPDIVEKGNITWIRIRTIDGKEGWILKDLLATVTPVPE